MSQSISNMSKVVLKKITIEIDGEEREFGFERDDLEKLYNILGAVLGKPYPGFYAYPIPYYSPNPYVSPSIPTFPTYPVITFC